jgi:hypothetical protein
MSNYIITQQDINMTRQSNRQIFSKVELLNHNFKVIDSIEGVLISDSFNNDSTSDIRRTYNAELFISDSSFLVGSDKKIWIDKYIRPYIGIKYLRTDEIIWYLKGTYVFNDLSYDYDASTKKLSLSCSDLICTLNGDRGGYVEGLSNTIPEGTDIRSAIIGILNDAGITKYNVVDIGKTIPYDQEFSVGTTYYEMLSQIVELYSGYEMFFDLDGTFIVQAIPTTKDEDSILDENVFAPLVISENIGQSFNKIYNCTQVWGKTLETDYYTQVVSSSNNIIYTATIDSLTGYSNYDKYGIRIPITCGDGPTININGLGALKIYEDDKLVKAERLIANTDYVFKYLKASNTLSLLGQYQAYGEYTNKETDCPFSAVNLGYVIKQVLNYDEIYSDSLCQQRAKYETWLATKMQDSINLEIISIPFLDVNWKVNYSPMKTGETNSYIIKSISGSDSEGKMSIQMIRYSELYPDVIPET